MFKLKTKWQIVRILYERKRWRRRNKKNSPKLKIESIEYSYPHIHHHQLVDICFSASPNASRCTLICSTRSITNGWLNLPFVESKNSWCFFGHSSRFSYSNACKTMSRRSKSLTNFDSGVWFSSYSYNKCRKYFFITHARLYDIRMHLWM